MKTNRLLTIFISLLLLNAHAVFAQNTYVPDDNFEQALIDLGYDSGELNDSVPTANIETLTSLDVSGKNIGDLNGIEDFTNLKDLFCSNNLLSSLNVNSNLALQRLFCFNNQLTSLDLSNNTNLQLLNCPNNNLIDLDLSATPNLSYLKCNSNKLSGLNIKNGNNSNLQLDARNNTNLLCIQVDDAKAAYTYTIWEKNAYTAYSEDCSNYVIKMTYVPDDNFEQALINLGLDIGELNDSVPTIGIMNLKSLWIAYRNITDLTGIEDFASLEELYCHNNKISEINLESNTNLQTLQIQNNNLLDINLTSNILLTQIDFHNNDLIDLDLSTNSLLINLDVSYNQLTGLNLRNGNNSNMSVYAGNNPNLLCIQVDDPVASFKNTNWYKNAYTAYSEDCSSYIHEMTYIPDDNFEQSLITKGLDFGGLNDSVPTVAIKNLKSLNISHKNIADLTGIEAFAMLEQLYCYNNDLIELDLSANSSLTDLNASFNQLTGLNLQNGNNSNMSVEVRYNPDLLCIQVDDPVASYEYTNWYKNAYAAYSEDCSSYIIEMTYVPDDNFEQALINLGLDFNSLNDSVPTIGIKSVINLNVSDESINDLTGIEDFENIEVLNCCFNNIEFLDLSKNIELLELNCYYNNLTSLDLQNNINLTKLNCQYNPLVSINLDNNINLQYLDCSYCQLTNINIQNNDKLETFIAGLNPPLCILVNDIELAGNKSSWYIDAWANYSLDCSVHDVEKIYLPDDNFENVLISMGYDFGAPDDSVYKAIVENITSLSIDNKKIKSLEGIKFFSDLEELNFNNNEVSTVDLSYNVNLKELNCLNNSLDSLNLFSNKNLIELDCSLNQLETLIVDSCLELQTLDCGNNNLQIINLSNNINLSFFDGRANDFSDIDLSKNIYLQYLNCGFNQISTLELSNYDSLEILACGSNNLTNLDLTHNVLLRHIYCGDNQITSLDLSKNNKLEYFNCENGLLTSLNLQNENNDILRAIDIMNNPNLFCVQVDDPAYSENNSKWDEDPQVVYSEDCTQPHLEMTYVPDDNFESALIDLGYDTWPLDDSVLTAKISTISFLDIENRNISDLTGIEDFIALNGLDCDKNKLNALNLFNNIALTFLYCDDNQINTLNFNANTALKRLYCQRNQLTELEISGNKNLEILVCNSNQLSSIDLSSNTALMELNCAENNLTRLNIRNENNHNLSQFSAENNPELLCIQVDSPTACENYTNWYKDDWASYSEDCGYLGAGVPLSEYNALVDFYNSTNGDNWTNNTNWLDTINYSVADWFGITVDSGHVTEIYFGPYEKYNINGSIPNSIKNLTKLESFVIVTDNLNGELPLGLFELTDLRTLYLSECEISGTLPQAIGNLINMERLGLEANNLEGVIPEEIGNLSKLNFLALQENNFTGQIPISLGELTNLEYLGLSANNLSGTIPASIGNLINLGWFLADGNQITGPLPVELANLENAVKINIDNNLIGLIDTTLKSLFLKKSSVESNRQIPDELSSLLLIDTLHLEGNQLQFNDIEAIFSWENYNSFNEFIYAPQDSIGVSTTQQASPGENLILSIENYFAGPSDRYQWYKNAASIPGATSATLNLTGLQLSDAGKYCCKITNPVASELTLYSRAITVQVTEEIKGAGVPLSEYEALIEIFDNFGGNNWSENLNWLDTINYSVGEWERITVENGHVTALDLSGLNLEGDISHYFADFDSLKWLDLSNNNFSGPFTSLFEKSALKNSIVSEESTLDYLNIKNNKYTFADLEPAINELNSINEFIYAPQSVIGQSIDTTVYKNQNIELTLNNYTPGESDDFVWYKDGIEISGANQLSFSIENATLADSGKYTCQVTNSLFTDLTLFSDTVKLSVLIPDGVDEFGMKNISIYPNPGEKRIFVETGNKQVHIKIFDLAGILVLEKKDFQSDWIEIQSFVPGIYLFSIEDENSEVINKKVIFK